ncbi:MAG: segregation/condensation protein A [Candidatus Jettenia caeni]|nr:segregation/condensation protein A [Candidatus Jettenia caeni]
MTDGYKIELDIYNGPVDLLLYLIQREEVNIYDIPIARITDQYLHHVEALQTLDMNIAGDFLVMAATLMYIKSYMLLPRTEAQGDEEENIDPRLSLVKQLLEYKRYKESTFILERRAAEWEKRLARPYKELPAETSDKEEEIALEGIGIWDLLQRFSQLMKQTLSDVSAKVTYDDTPIQEYMDMVVKKVHTHTSIAFADLFTGIHERIRIIGFFLALLELVRLHKIRIEQPENYADIQISLHSSPLDEGLHY